VATSLFSPTCCDESKLSLNLPTKIYGGHIIQLFLLKHTFRTARTVYYFCLIKADNTRVIGLLSLSIDSSISIYILRNTTIFATTVIVRFTSLVSCLRLVKLAVMVAIVYQVENSSQA
jgi:hypothetical protein